MCLFTKQFKSCNFSFKIGMEAWFNKHWTSIVHYFYNCQCLILDGFLYKLSTSILDNQTGICAMYCCSVNFSNSAIFSNVHYLKSEAFI